MDTNTTCVPPSEMFFSEVLDMTHDCLLLIDLNSNLIVYANRACEACYGYNQEEFMGIPITQLNISEPNKVYKQIQKVIKKAPESHRFLTIHASKEGRKFPVEVISKLVVINGRRYLLSHITDVTRNTKMQDRINTLIRHLSNQAYRDYLTGAYNRAYLYQVYLPRLIGCQVGVLVLDVDRFKTINETFGHEGGDLVLKMVVKLAESCLRNRDKIFRYGGDEFVIVLRDTEAAEVNSVAQRIKDVVAGTPIITQKGKVCCSVTIGKAKGYIVENSDLESLIITADSELMKIKSLRPSK